MSEVLLATQRAAIDNVKALSKFEVDFLAMIEASGLNRLEFARLAVLPKRTITYILKNPTHWATLSNLTKLALACGYKLEIKLVKIE